MAKIERKLQFCRSNKIIQEKQKQQEFGIYLTGISKAEVSDSQKTVAIYKHKHGLQLYVSR